MKAKIVYKLSILIRKGSFRYISRTANRVLKLCLGQSLYHKTIGKLRNKIIYGSLSIPAANTDILWRFGIKDSISRPPLVSIIVPCYNHAQYLRQRLDTIYQQTYQNFEVILLDDASTDNSVELLSEYADKYSEKTRIYINDTNTGSPFHQWKMGFDLAKGELYWIAESDDYCELNFLEEMIKPFSDPAVTLACSKISILNESTGSIENTNWFYQYADRDIMEYTMTSATFTKHILGYNNELCNVSGLLFRRPGVIPAEVETTFCNMKASGDYFFYLWLCRGGCISFIYKTTDYFRRHKNCTSYRAYEKKPYYSEHKDIIEFIAENYDMADDWLERVHDNLVMQYKSTLQNSLRDLSIDKEYLREIQLNKKPNIMIACLSLASGGGEIFPIILANELHRLDYTVTLLDFNLGGYNEEIRETIHCGVPLVRLKDISELGEILRQLNGDIIHSHHGTVDRIIAELLSRTSLNCKHIITLHGMYEMMSEFNIKDQLQITSSVCKKYVYVADKNLIPFKEHGFLNPEQFVKISNGLPIVPYTTYNKKEFGLSERDFVFCIASRGIKEKGWKEAIYAIQNVNRHTNRDVHLFILGDGPERKKLDKQNNKFIHFMGERNDVRSFFSMADAGILPTYFSGESYPLMLIECIQCNIPVITTDIAEIPNMIIDESGNSAGLLVQHSNEGIDVAALEAAIFRLVTDEELYNKLRGNCCSVARKFDMNRVILEYLKVYKQVYTTIK